MKLFRPLVFSIIFLSLYSVSSAATVAIDSNAVRWADSVLCGLSLEQQAAQVIVARVPLQMTEKQERKFRRQIADWEVGGVCFFAGTTASQLQLTQRLQAESRIPLMICLDAESGVGMRLTDVPPLPCQMMLGAMPRSADSLVTAMGVLMGRQCRQMGVHVNFAPVVDVNTNPLNPIIGRRSFGQDPDQVACRASLLMQAMQAQDVMAVAKHFPGHGDTDADSHLLLPVVRQPRSYIDSVLLIPFQRLIHDGVGGCMIAHLYVPALDTNRQRPSTLSNPIVEGLLRSTMEFDGLVFTDGMDMKAVSDRYDAGTAAVMAIQAGNDVLLLPPDIDEAIKSLVKTAKRDPLFRKRLGQCCRRILLHKYQFKSSLPQTSFCVSREDDLTYNIALRSVTLLRTQSRYVGRRFDLTTSSEKNLLPFLLSLPDTVPVTICVYDAPYLLNRVQPILDSARQPLNLVVAYQDLPAVRRAVDTLLHHAGCFEGRLPVALAAYPMGYGLDSLAPTPVVTPLQPFEKQYPQYAAAIDSIVQMGIERHAYPGCQLLIISHDSVLLDRCYGNLTYDGEAPVLPSTRYDLASVTKVAATTLAVMRLVQEKRIGLDDKLSRHLRYLRFTDKRNITLREVLSHCARLQPGDASWRKLLDDETLCRRYASDSLPDITETVLKGIVKSSRIPEKHKMVYSDLGFILLGDLVKTLSGVSIDRYVDSCFYSPMHLTHMGFSPLMHGVDKDSIAPTEYDTLLRGGLICGTVHDPTAAAMGGVAGHAGLFANASDVGKLCTMMLHEGIYHGDTLIMPEVFRSFNQRYFAGYGNRRALGFDKPLFQPTPTGNTAVSVSQSSFGHTGFTGTMIWMDPANQLVFVFLSNRVCPQTRPNVLADLNIRTDIQELVYRALATSGTD
mgnify:CR=1 FL=1